MLSNKSTYIYAGSIWCFIFALMSFYWASGGMLGGRSLGGKIYHLALQRPAPFITLVWITGFIKLGGSIFLLLLLKEWSGNMFRILYFLSLTAGILVFLYGFVNFCIYLLGAIGWISLPMSRFALTWRLAFWEPFWMVGGVLFLLSAFQFNREKKDLINTHTEPG